jgi:hypothetical protein
LTWSSVTGATSYTLYRSGTQVYHGSGLNYTDTGAATGTNYSYTVLASDASGNSALSSGVSVLTLPAAPTGLVVNGATTTSLNLSWTANTDTVTGYKIYQNGSPLATQSGTTYTASGLSAGSSYTYTVAAYNATNIGATTAGSGTTLPTTATITTLTSPTGSLFSYGTPDVLNVLVSSDSGTPTGTVTLTDSGTSVPGCVNLIVASGAASCSPFLTVGPVTLVATYVSDGNFATSTSSTLTQSVQRSSQFSAPTITGLPSAALVGSSATVSVTTGGDGARSVSTSTPGVCTVLAMTVDFNNPGTCSLIAHVATGTDYTAADGSTQSVVVSAVPVTPPGPPTAVAAQATNAAATLTWAPPLTNGGAAITGYIVTASPGGATVRVSGTTTSAQITGLTNATTYTFTVSAFNSAGAGAPSAPSNPVEPQSPPIPGNTLTLPVTGMASTPDGAGYWLVSAAGGVGAYGSASYYGSMAGHQLNSPIDHIVATPDGKGYWLVAGDGGTFTFGDAGFYGSMGGTHLNKPVVDIAPTPDGKGYWLVASDGGIFAFGDAAFHGSMGGAVLNKPVVGIAPDPTTGGYWEVASDGGIFSFAAPFYGSTGSLVLNQPINSMATTPDGHGYWFVASDGGIFSFGDAAFHGSTGGAALPAPIVSLASDPATGGYWEVGGSGVVYSFGAPFYGQL